MMFGEPPRIDEPEPVGLFRRVLAVLVFMLTMPILIFVAMVFLPRSRATRGKLEWLYDKTMALVIKINPQFDV